MNANVLLVVHIQSVKTPNVEAEEARHVDDWLDVDEESASACIVLGMPFQIADAELVTVVDPMPYAITGRRSVFVDTGANGQSAGDKETDVLGEGAGEMHFVEW